MLNKSTFDNQTIKNTEADLIEIIDKISKTSSTLGLDLVEISGAIDQVISTHSNHTRDFSSMARMANEMLAKNRDMNDFAIEARTAINRASDDTNKRVQSAVEALDTVGAWSKSARQIGDKMGTLSGSLKDVAAITKSIESIAAATTMIALNATIEAARAGEAGRGFAVVAQEIKALANQTKEASATIQKTLLQLGKDFEDIEETSNQTVKIAERMNSELSNQTSSMNQIMVAFEQVSGLIENVTDCAGHIQSETATLQSNLERLDCEVADLDAHLKDGGHKLEKIALVSEEIMQLTCSAGVKNEDSEIIEIAQTAALRIGSLFEDAIRGSSITPTELFDTIYVEIPGTNPIQYRTGFLSLTDKILPSIQETILSQNSDIVFCAAVDRNGYLPTHNQKFSQAQRKGEIEWNTANCRNRRIFNDRVGLRAGQNTLPFLVQAYRRDMGNNQFAMMKDISAPIIVNNKHWGSFRIGLRAKF